MISNREKSLSDSKWAVSDFSSLQDRKARGLYGTALAFSPMRSEVKIHLGSI